MVLESKSINQQLLALIEVVTGKERKTKDAPIAAIAAAVLCRKAEIASEIMPLSAFNVQLSLSHGANGIPIVSFPASGGRTDIRNAITSAIEDFVASETDLDSNVSAAFRYITDEIIDNITEHADTSTGFLNVTWNSDVLTVCIADGGKTIYGSYLDRHFKGIGSDQAALHAAVSGVSTKNRPGAENRGFGISTSLKMIIRGLDSMMIILSGRGLLIRDEGRNDYTELPEPIYLPGTIVCFTLPIHKDGFNIYDYIGG